MKTLAALFALASMTCAAEAANLSKAYEDCINRETTNVAWGVCGGQEIERQDARLNKAWKSAVACFDAGTEARQKLLDEQRLWIKWKEAACQFYSANDAYGGPMFGREGQVLHGPACQAGIIAERADFLEELGKFCGAR